MNRIKKISLFIFIAALTSAFFACGGTKLTAKAYMELPIWEKERQAMDTFAASVAYEDPIQISAALAQVSTLAGEIKTAIMPLKPSLEALPLHVAQLALCDALAAAGTAWDAANPEKGMETFKAIDATFQAMQTTLAELNAKSVK